MDTNQYKEAQRFLDQFKMIDFQVPLQNMKREIVTVAGKKYYKDLYLVEKLFPTLIQGLESLSRQVQILMPDKNNVDTQVKNRFNPCIFLAQYLMRHNHNIKTNEQTHLTKLFYNYSQVQKFSRFFIKKHENIFKLFVKSIGKQKKICDISELKLYARDLDELLGLKGNLKDYLSNNKYLNKNKNEIKFSDIIEQISKFASMNNMQESQFQKIFSK